MSESRELTERGWWGGPGMWGRPPVGSWPPCPPGTRPPDCFSNLFRIEQCYEDVIQLKRFLTRIMTEIMQSDPGLNVRIQGVTDGSDAAPGEVGEYVTNSATVPVPGDGVTVVPVCSIQLTPGDWELGGELGFSGADCSGVYTDFSPISNAPTPARGATLWKLGGGALLVDGTTIPTSPGVRVSSAQPSQAFLRAEVTSVGGVAVQMWGQVWARRVR